MPGQAEECVGALRTGCTTAAHAAAPRVASMWRSAGSRAPGRFDSGSSERTRGTWKGASRTSRASRLGTVWSSRRMHDSRSGRVCRVHLDGLLAGLGDVAVAWFVAARGDLRRKEEEEEPGDLSVLPRQRGGAHEPDQPDPRSTRAACFRGSWPSPGTRVRSTPRTTTSARRTGIGEQAQERAVRRAVDAGHLVAIRHGTCRHRLPRIGRRRTCAADRPLRGALVE